ncbi:MAG TPA: hypothetical protein VFE84_10065 [Patescibacteria group bacterium]|nr:hypothetical protein [Patescibacteria group bacterium]
MTPARSFRLASGDRLRVDPRPREVWLTLLEAPISRDVERLVVLTREEASGLSRVLAKIVETE